MKSDSPGLNQYQQRIDSLLRELGISPEGIAARNLCVCQEAQELVLVETECDGREHQLTPVAARAWLAMKSAAQTDGIGLQIVSAYRSVERQADIIRRKLEQGQTPAAILRASAPPGYSEHHTGCAIDIATAGCEPLEEIFETSDAFFWLTRHAGRFDFYLSYPRGNPSGYCYEPWHWLHRFAQPSISDGKTSQGKFVTKDFNPQHITQRVASPCISVCEMNAQTGWCEGCWRTIDEIMQWSSASDQTKRAIWAEIRRRQSEVGASHSGAATPSQASPRDGEAGNGLR